MIEQERLLANPFPGLRPFEMDENELFYGRDGQSDEVLAKLRAAKFVAIVGTSGSGKSSLVRAGLLPALLSGHMTSAGSSWRIAVFRPGNDPVGNLARALAAPDVFGAGAEQGAGDRLALIERALRRSSLGLLEVVTQARMAPHENLLILADQFEELFRFRKKSSDAHPEDEAAAFVKLLLEAKQAGRAADERLPIYVILTMRSDYLGDCAHFWGLPEAINEGQYLIPRMTDDDRREAVTGPVIIGGGEITAPLVNRLLNDAGDDPAQLPILQHALMRTWDYWKTHATPAEPIDLPHYEQIGGMPRALSNHADEAFLGLSPELQTVAEKLFKSLTEKEADSREGRRPATVGEIAAAAQAGEDEVQAVVEAFRAEGRSFLMPPPSVPLASDTLIDISHESLIRGWQRLRQWVDEEAQSARHYRRLADTAALFPDAEGYLRDPALQLGLDWRDKHNPTAAWAQRYHPGFEKTIEYLEASKANREAEAAEIELKQKEKIERELKHAQAIAEAERRRTKLRNWGLLLLSALLLMMMGTTVYALRQQQIAVQERDNAKQQQEKAEVATFAAEKARSEAEEAKLTAYKARNTAEQAQRETAEQRDAADRERKEAVKQRDAARRATVEADRQRDIAKGALADAQQQRDIALEAQTEAQTQRDIALRAQAEAEQQIATVKEIDSSAPYYKQVLRGHQGPVRSAAFGLHDKLVITAGDDRIVKVWDLTGGVAKSADLDIGPVSGVAHSRDGTLFATVSDDGQLSVLDTNTSMRRWSTPPGGRRRAVVFSPDDKTIAVIATRTVTARDAESDISPTQRDPSTSVVELWGLTGDEPLVLAGHSGTINAFEFSPDGKYVVTASADGTARAWDAATGNSVGEPHRHLGEVNSARFSPDGKLVVTASSDGTAHVWDALTGELLVRRATAPDGQEQLDKSTLSHGGPVRSARFSPDGKHIVTTSQDAAYLWEPDESAGGSWAKTSANSPTRLAGHTDEVTDAVFSPDGQYFVTISRDRTARLWETSRSAFSAATFSGHIKPVTGVAFSADGKSLLSASEDRTARVWDLSGIGAFTIAEIELKAEPAEYNGNCPVTVRIGGWINTSGRSGTVKYKFVRSDGTQSLPQELAFDAPGTKLVSETILVDIKTTDRGGNPFPIDGVVELEVEVPGGPKIRAPRRATYRVQCRKPEALTTGADELTDARLKQIMPGAPDDQRALYLSHLRRAMAEFGINTPLRQAAFLTQVAITTGDLRLMVEPGTDEALERRYGNRKDLGNYEPGDGARFRGRGAFQITGRSNYQSLGQLLGEDLLAKPERAALPELAFRTAALYWQRNGFNELADRDDIAVVARRLVGPTRDLERQQEYYARAKQALGAVR